MKKITILGSTGSIGTQALEIIEKNPDKFKVEALTCGSNISLFSMQLKKFAPKFAVCANETEALKLQMEFTEIEFSYGEEGLITAASKTDCDMVLNALIGMMGLLPTYHAIMAGKDLALANKEALVVGGKVIMDAAEQVNIKLLPVDSEHSAIFQCLEGNSKEDIKKIILTASGGPFRGFTPRQLENVTVEQALKHPSWSMGNKITIDSATMMNKGLEVIEAKWLFDVNCINKERYEDKIEVIIHPESIVHSMVEYKDGAILAQLGLPDMRTPIAYAFTHPDRLAVKNHGLDVHTLSELHFEKPNTETFKCLALAYEALNKGGSYPVILNGANEMLVEQFLNKKIKFMDIQNNLEKLMNEHKPVYDLTLDSIIQIDKEIREKVGLESR